MEDLNADLPIVVLQTEDRRIEVLPIRAPRNEVPLTADHPNGAPPIEAVRKEAVSLPAGQEKGLKEVETLPRKIPIGEIIPTVDRKIAVPIAVIEETDPMEIDQIPLRIKIAVANVLR